MNSSALLSARKEVLTIKTSFPPLLLYCSCGFRGFFRVGGGGGGVRFFPFFHFFFFFFKLLFIYYFLLMLLLLEVCMLQVFVVFCFCLLVVFAYCFCFVSFLKISCIYDVLADGSYFIYYFYYFF